jgi:hypothetical protein
MKQVPKESNSIHQESNFQITIPDLCEIVNQIQLRTFSEEIDLVEKMGGFKFLIQATTRF